MENEDKKLAILEELMENLGKRQSITPEDITKLLKSKKLSKMLDVDEVSDYFAASGVTIIGESGKIKRDDPLTMYFHDIGDVKILGKEKELKIAKRMRGTINKLQKSIPMLTLSIRKFLFTGFQLEHGQIPIDEYTISSFRPDDITPTEHRTDVIFAMDRIEALYQELIAHIRSSKKDSLDSKKYWDKKFNILSQIQKEIEYINPSLRIVESILPIFDRLKIYWGKTTDKFQEFLKLAGITEEDAEKIFYASEKERKKIGKKLGIGEESTIGVLKEYKRYSRVKTRITRVSLIPLSSLLESVDNIPVFLNQYEDDREQLIKANVRLVVNIARNYMNQGVDFLDLIQEGNHALLKAVERFDSNKGYKLATYGIWWIRQAMIRAIAEQGQVIRLPAYLVQWARKYSRIFQQLSQQLGRDPTVREVSENLGLREREVEELLQALQGQISLDKKLGYDESSRTLGEVIEDKTAEPPSLMATIAVLQHEIQKILSSLSPREAKVISLRFGLEDNFPRTLEEIGKQFGLSRERIRQIETRALTKLRHPARLRILEAFLKE